MIMEEEVLRLLNKLKYKIKNQLKDELSKILLGLEFKSNNSINSKCWKIIVKKILLTI